MENWLKSVSAFANGTGGTLVFGTAEDGTVAGVKDMETASEVIRLKIEECIVPPPEVRLKVKRAENGKRLLLLEVTAGRETPYYYMGDGRAEVFVRAEKASIPASAQELKSLILKGRYLSYDTQVSGYDFKDFTFTELCVAYQEWTGDRMNERKFESFGLMKSGKLTYAGLLFADASPVPNSRLVCSRWKGKERTESAEYRGGLIYLINKGIWFVRSNTKILWREENGRKTELPDYDSGSVFEAVVNAFAHRDYFIRGSEVRIDIFEEYLTVCSPGGMPDGEQIQKKDTDTVLSVRRNPVIADMFYQIGYMKRQGTGLRNIRSLCEETKGVTCGRTPEFYSDKGQFTVVLKNLNSGGGNIDMDGDRNADTDGGEDGNGGNKAVKPETSPEVLLNENEKRILAILKEQPAVSTDNLSRESKIAKRTVERILQGLKKKGAVVREGSRRSGSWKVMISYCERNEQ